LPRTVSFMRSRGVAPRDEILDKDESIVVELIHLLVWNVEDGVVRR
jgi:hypothetical protein